MVLEQTAAAPPAESAPLDVVETRYDSELAQRLVAEVQAEYVARYGGQDDSPVDPGHFAPPTGAFLVVSAGGEPVEQLPVGASVGWLPVRTSVWRLCFGSPVERVLLERVRVGAAAGRRPERRSAGGLADDRPQPQQQHRARRHARLAPTRRHHGGG